MKLPGLMGVLLVSGLVGCGGPPPPESPAEDPGLPEPTVAEPTAGEAEEDAPDEGGAEAGAAAGTVPEGSGLSEGPAGERPTTPAPEPAGKTACKDLKKGTCKVTKGCAWRDGPGGGCIEQEGEE